MRYILTLLATFSLCLIAQGMALRAMGGRFLKSESNYFSSLGRIQAGAKGNPEAMVLGSSISGRLPDRAQGFNGWANMGCDGGSAVDVLRAMDAGILPTSPILVIEANTLHLALEGKATEVGAAMRRKWFRAGIHWAPVAAYARPSAYFYSLLLARKIGGFDTTGGLPDLGEEQGPIEPREAIVISRREQVLVEEVSAILKRLRARGSRAVLVWLPPGRPDGQQLAPWILELAQRAGCHCWDLGGLARPGTVELTDGVHMAAPSAARTVRSLTRGVMNRQQDGRN